jgi:hypothetical protein
MVFDHSTDFWGVAVPAWLGAVGTILASVVALIALYIGRRAAGGVRQIASGSNQSGPSTPIATEPVQADATGGGSMNVTATLTAEAEVRRAESVPVTWRIEEVEQRSGYRLRNTSPTIAVLTKMELINDAARLERHGMFPSVLLGGEAFDFTIQRIIGGPEVVGIRIGWSEDNGDRDWVFYIL